MREIFELRAISYTPKNIINQHSEFLRKISLHLTDVSTDNSFVTLTHYDEEK